jgi:transcription elongation factor GreA
MVMNYKLVAQSESDLSKGFISIDSPIGQGLLGKEVGDMAEVTVPVGTIKLEILEIFRD